jgi:DNA-binding SARP family transcriptional activator
VQLALLGGSELRCGGDTVPLSSGALRLLSFLAMQEGGVQRAAAAEALWPNHRAGRAAANLRSVLWQARQVGTTPIVDCAGQRVCLAPSVQVDVREMARRAHQITTFPSPAAGPPAYDVVVQALTRELLPGWSDDWIMPERERWDQVRLHALEALARWLITAEQYLAALEAAMTAVAIEPIRESAHRTVIEVHIAEGNLAYAIKHYQRYRELMQRELGVMPSQSMDRLVRSLGCLGKPLDTLVPRS